MARRRRAGPVREPPPEFVAELRRRFGAEYSCRWNEKKQRWAIITPSTVGLPVEQLFGWFHDPTRSTWNPNTKRFEHPPIPVDRETGLPPFRELDAQAQHEILEAMEKTFLANPHDGAGTWAKHIHRARAHNARVSRTRIREAAELRALAITEMDLRRPWLKHHTGSPRERAMARRIPG